MKINLFSVCDGPEGESLKSKVPILFMWHYKVLKISLTPLMHAIYQENGPYGLGFILMTTEAGIVCIFNEPRFWKLFNLHCMAIAASV